MSMGMIGGISTVNHEMTSIYHNTHPFTYSDTPTGLNMQPPTLRSHLNFSYHPPRIISSLALHTHLIPLTHIPCTAYTSYPTLMRTGKASQFLTPNASSISAPTTALQLLAPTSSPTCASKTADQPTSYIYSHCNYPRAN